MDYSQLIEFINSNIYWAPYIVFGLLILAGFNFPVSEDLMIFITALLAAKHPDHLIPLLSGIFLGAYLSDLISYSLGRFIGPKLWNIKFFSKMVSKKKLNTISNYYDKYGVITLIFGRFIPFGVRNGLFLTAGLGKMNFLKFSLSDLLACIISTSLYFPLYYFHGEKVIEYVKKGNVVIFITALLIISFIYFQKKKKK